MASAAAKHAISLRSVAPNASSRSRTVRDQDAEQDEDSPNEASDDRIEALIACAVRASGRELDEGPEQPQSGAVHGEHQIADHAGRQPCRTAALRRGGAVQPEGALQDHRGLGLGGGINAATPVGGEFRLAAFPTGNDFWFIQTYTFITAERASVVDRGFDRPAQLRHTRRGACLRRQKRTVGPRRTRPRNDASGSKRPLWVRLAGGLPDTARLSERADPCPDRCIPRATSGSAPRWR